jgi:acyl carrier protein
MSEFPQTPNKKIDRKALPAPEADMGEAETAFEPPATGVETRVAELWTELLGVQRVDRRDNFFESGGHSLLAMQFVVRVHNMFGVELPLTSLLEQPTVAGLAEIIEALSRSAAVKVSVQTVEA